MKLRILSLAIITGLVSQISYADNTCSKDGGILACLPLSTTPWSAISPCTNIDMQNDPAYCGLYGSYSTGWETGCASISPITDDNIVKRFTDYATYWSTYGWWRGPLSGFTDTGWNYNVPAYDNMCSGPISYVNGIQLSDQRKFQFYTNNNPSVQIVGHRTRNIVCPDGSISINGQCTIPTKTPSCSAGVGNPCSVTTGNKSQSETDWTSPNTPLKISRTYNSFTAANKLNGWTFNQDSRLDIGQVQDIQINIDSQNESEINSVVRLTRSDGSRIIAQRNFTDTTVAGNTTWFIDRDVGLQLIKVNDTTWQVKNVRTGTVETYQAVSVNPTAATSTTAATSSPTTTSTTTTDNTKLILSRIDYLNGQFITYTSNNGQISSATDNLGNTLTYQYTNGLLTQIQLPDGNTITYGYTNGNLTTVQRPGYGTKTYVYGESDKDPTANPYLLTGIIDENGVRYANYAYDNQNHGVLTEHAGGAQRYTLSFNTDSNNQITNTQVTDDNGSNRSYDLNPISGTNRVTHWVNGSQDTSNQYDQGGNLTSETKNGITTKYTHDVTRNLETSRIDAYGTSSSKITLTEWDANKPLKTKITEGSADSNGNLSQALRITSYTYDNQGNPLTKTITDPINNLSRTWRYTYNANSQKLTETNPQGQVSKWVYDNKGNLTSSTDAQGLVTSYSDLNADGKPQTITSPTGQVTKLTYDAAGRILTQTTTVTNPSLADISKGSDGWITFENWWRKLFNKPLLPNPIKSDITHDSTQVATTTYQYDGVGQLISTTLPDGQIISYQYDNAHRLIGMTDSLGNKISYTLNAAGDIIQTDSKDNTGQLAQSSKQSFDTLGRLSAQTGNNGQQDSFSYDNQDNLTQSSDTLSRTNQNQYDTLKRKIQSTDAVGGKSSSTYNAIDQLTSQTDANGVTTTYTYDAFGDVLATSSADTGTDTNTYNATGQLVSQMDGAGRVQTYTYDSAGRLVKRSDSAAKTLAQYTYDAAGRIISLTDTSGSTAYQYNSQNQVIEKKQTTQDSSGSVILTTRYHYTAGGQLDQELLPSGQLVQYQYTKGVLQGVSIKTNDGNSTAIIDSIRYSPNGITGYNWSQNKQAVKYQYDLDGRLTQISDPTLQRQYQYDAGNRITNLLDSQANLTAQFSHDPLDRLTSQNIGSVTYGYSYDNNTNRTQTTQNSQTTATPVKSGTNQYQNYSYDASGKVTSDGQRSYSYNSEGRIERIQNGSVGIYNAYNALGQRVQKNSGNTKTYFAYDESGALAGEYDGSGSILREYVYLAGRPIAMVSGEKPNQVLQVHSDHLGTPRAVSDVTNQVLWRWEGDAFGTSLPQLATVKMPLRMAGQYADDETGLFYNYFRFYDPKTGRYVENDPIGLAGGMNRWAYVGGSPLRYTDPRGQNPLTAEIGCLLGSWAGPIGCGVGGAIGGLVGAVTTIAILSTPSDSAQDKAIDNARSVEDFCNKCTATDTRSSAQVKAYNYAGFSMYEGYPKPWTDFNPPYGSQFKKGPVWGDFMRKYYPPFFGEWSDSGHVEEHPFGHPDLPPGKNHDCPHFVAWRNNMPPMEFPYQPGSP